MRSVLTVVSVTGMLAVLCGCPTAGDMDDKGGVSFSKDVQPILAASCAGCHSPGGFAQLAGVTLDLRSGRAFASLTDDDDDDDDIVVPGDAEASLLFEKVSSDSPSVGERMPLFGTALPDSDIAAIREWIDAGAPNN